ncbi:MAG: carbohydrate ABC transporter permease [Lachnospiraceae bacterium]|nr:carbohydrate ABC transporter permease [Lachnospiraceae bacterium]
MRSKEKNERCANAVQKGILVIVGLFVLLPIYIALVNTFKASDIILSDPLSIPIPPILDNIRAVLENSNTDLLELYKNSLILVVAGTAITIAVSSLASYYLARVRTRFSQMLRIYFLVGLMVPYVIVYLPLCIFMRKTGIPFNVTSLIFIFVSGNISFSTYMYTNFIRALPVELEESASLDGATAFQRFWMILFPLLKPTTATVMIFVGLGIWNDFQTPLLMGNVQTITVGIYTAVGPYSANWGVVFAYVLFAAVPVVILYLLAQKSFVAGLTSGALKG